MVGSSHPGGGEASKGWAVRPLKRHASWVQNVVNCLSRPSVVTLKLNLANNGGAFLSFTERKEGNTVGSLASATYNCQQSTYNTFKVVCWLFNVDRWRSHDPVSTDFPRGARD